MNEEKIEAILKYPIPTTIKKIQTFIKLAKYYQQYITKFLKKVALITDLLKKNKSF